MPAYLNQPQSGGEISVLEQFIMLTPAVSLDASGFFFGFMEPKEEDVSGLMELYDLEQDARGGKKDNLTR